MTTSNSNKNKAIYIEKFDADSMDHELIPFAQIDRNVIQNIKNPGAALIWFYLQSMPRTWKPNKHQIMNHFDISERTYKRHMAFLRDSCLIEYKRIRNKNGQLESVELMILNGRKFKKLDHPAKNDGEIEKNKSPVDKTKKTNKIKASHHRAKKPPCGNLAPYINKQSSYKNKKSNKNTFSSSKSVDNFSDSKPKRPYATKEERIENEVKIRAREEKAEREKAEEIKGARRFGEIKSFNSILDFSNYNRVTTLET